MVKKQQMGWSQRGAHLLLQIRTRVLDEEWENTFRRWYPGFRPRAQAEKSLDPENLPLSYVFAAQPEAAWRALRVLDVGRKRANGAGVPRQRVVATPGLGAADVTKNHPKCSGENRLYRNHLGNSVHSCAITARKATLNFERNHFRMNRQQSEGKTPLKGTA